MNHYDQIIRYFKCRHNGEEFGRFKGKYPILAASKVFSALLRTRKIGNDIEDSIKIDDWFVFEIRECTKQGYVKKNYYYLGKRIRFDENIPTVKIANKVIRFRYRNRIKRIDRDFVPEEFLIRNR